MNKTVKIFYGVFSVLFIFYLLLPGPDYPEQLSDAQRSTEPADMESPLRRGYYTDTEREPVMEHYFNQFSRSPFMGISFPTYRLNYPPEEAQVIIRDQTRSTFLEEIVHPFRESLFVNGFRPTKDNEVIIVDDYKWLQKVIIKMVPSNGLSRLITGVFTLIVLWFLITEYSREISDMKKFPKKLLSMILK